MAVHEVYVRIAEELEKDPNFWDKHMRLLDDAISAANTEEKKLIDDAVAKARKDRILMGLSVRLLNGEDELTQSIFTSDNFKQQAHAQLRKELEAAYVKSYVDLQASHVGDALTYQTKNRYNV